MGTQELAASQEDAVIPTTRVVLVDDRSERRTVMRRMVEQALGAGSVVAEVGSEAEALAAAERQFVDAVVIEVQMPVASGLATIAALRAAHPSLLLVVCSFHHDQETQRLAREAGADAYLVKPVNSRDLRRALESERQLSEAAVTV